MFTAEHYRVKAAECDVLLTAARLPDEARKFRELAISYLLLAENVDWMTANGDKSISPEENTATTVWLPPTNNPTDPSVKS